MAVTFVVSGENRSSFGFTFWSYIDGSRFMLIVTSNNMSFIVAYRQQKVVVVVIGYRLHNTLRGSTGEARKISAQLLLCVAHLSPWTVRLMAGSRLLLQGINTNKQAIRWEAAGLYAPSRHYSTYRLSGRSHLLGSGSRAGRSSHHSAWRTPDGLRIILNKNPSLILTVCNITTKLSFQDLWLMHWLQQEHGCNCNVKQRVWCQSCIETLHESRNRKWTFSGLFVRISTFTYCIPYILHVTCLVVCLSNISAYFA